MLTYDYRGTGRSRSGSLRDCAVTMADWMEQDVGAPAAVTNLSKRMQAGGLIERAGDDHDGRMTRLRLTAYGERASRQSRRVLDELNGHLKAGFSDAELAVVARWLEQVAALEQA